MNIFCKNPFENKVKCETCRCWLDKINAQEVKIINFGFRSAPDSQFYCQKDKKKYTEIHNFTGATEYYAKFEVDEDGNLKHAKHRKK